VLWSSEVAFTAESGATEVVASRRLLQMLVHSIGEEEIQQKKVHDYFVNQLFHSTFRW
jgi:hypothetical protein